MKPCSSFTLAIFGAGFVCLGACNKSDMPPANPEESKTTAAIETQSLPTAPPAAIVEDQSALAGDLEPPVEERPEDEGMYGEGEAPGEVWVGIVGGSSSSSSSAIIGGSGFGGRGKPVPRVRQAKAQVIGALDRDIVRRIVRAHINEIRSCYNQGLARDEHLQGRVAVEFVVNAMGKVDSSRLESSTLHHGLVEACMVDATLRWKFPKPSDGKSVKVIYPFTLSAS